MHPDRMTVLAAVRDVKLSPRPSGLPGSDVLQSLIDGLAFWGLLASLAALVVGAAVWAWASHAQNHHYAANGRRASGVESAARLRPANIFL